MRNILDTCSVPGAFDILLQAVLIANLGNRYYCPHFIDDETEVLIGKSLAQRHKAGKWHGGI